MLTKSRYGERALTAAKVADPDFLYLGCLGVVKKGQQILAAKVIADSQLVQRRSAWLRSEVHFRVICTI
jgi:hypothetical protein